MKTFSIYIGSNNKTHVVEIMKAKEIISRRYDGFTYYFTKGYWKGETEDSVKFEIITDDKDGILSCVERLKEELEQESILVSINSDEIIFI